VKTALCIPTLNAGSFAGPLAEAIRAQTLRPDEFLVIDSGSTDGTVATLAAAGARLHRIPKSEFNHGGTRQMAVEMLAGADVVLFLTQDAIPASPDAFARLVACFADPQVAIAYGRQLPRRAAGPIEAHARLFNYPPESRTRRLQDRAALGLKTVFVSNSFAAYRRADLLAAGGFPGHVIFGEDTYLVAKMLLAGRSIAYCAEAEVFHSHEYAFAEEFRRYFDIGVLHAREPWIRECFGGAEGEGLRYVRSEAAHLMRAGPWLIPSALVRTALKFLGYRLGLREDRLAPATKKRLSMLRSYWDGDPGRRPAPAVAQGR
jgi:rhamnosyltransferase